MMQFPVAIHKDAGTGYGVTVPDLPGCFSAGDTLEEAISSTHEAIACHIEGLLLDGKPIPERATIETHRAREDNDVTWALVGVDVSRLSGAIRRVNITMPARVLAIVDEAAAREGESRLGLIARAALSFIQQRPFGVELPES